MDERYSIENMRKQASMNRWVQECTYASKEYERSKTAKHDDELVKRLIQGEFPDYIKKLLK